MAIDSEFGVVPPQQRPGAAPGAPVREAPASSGADLAGLLGALLGGRKESGGRDAAVDALALCVEVLVEDVRYWRSKAEAAEARRTAASAELTEYMAQMGRSVGELKNMVVSLELAVPNG